MREIQKRRNRRRRILFHARDTRTKEQNERSRESADQPVRKTDSNRDKNTHTHTLFLKKKNRNTDRESKQRERDDVAHANTKYDSEIK